MDPGSIHDKDQNQHIRCSDDEHQRIARDYMQSTAAQTSAPRDFEDAIVPSSMCVWPALIHRIDNDCHDKGLRRLDVY